jgi:hypothetical protein
MHINKHLHLQELLEKNSHVPTQGSEEWLKLRMKSVGGSDVASIIGESPYSDIKSFVLSKLNWSSFKGSPQTAFGCLFENVTRNFTEKYFNCKIYETSSIPGCIPFTSYSPDGLGIVSNSKINMFPINMPSIFNKSIDLLNNSIELSGEKCILFEFKSPHSRIPNNSIPSTYISQVLSGLCHIPITDMGIFVDACFRKCSLDDLSTNNYDYEYHKYDKNKFNNESSIAIGIIFVYIDKLNYNIISEFENKIAYENYLVSQKWEKYSSVLKKDYTDKTFSPLMMNEIMKHYISTMAIQTSQIDQTNQPSLKPNKLLLDFGKVSTQTFNSLLFNINKKHYNVHYSDIHIPCEDNIKPFIEKSINEFILKCDIENKTSIGFIPYKLMEYCTIPVERQPNYMSDLEPFIANIFNQIDKIRCSDDPIKTYKEIYCV